jgi:hypothetical protein
MLAPSNPSNPRRDVRLAIVLLKTSASPPTGRPSFCILQILTV